MLNRSGWGQAESGMELILGRAGIVAMRARSPCMML